MFVFLNPGTSFSNVKYHKESNGTKIEGPGLRFASGSVLGLVLGLGLKLGTLPCISVR